MHCWASQTSCKLLQETGAQQQALLQAASKAGLLHKLTVADAQQILDHAQPAQLLQELAAGPVPAADVFLTEPFYASLESLPPTTQLRCIAAAECAQQAVPLQLQLLVMSLHG